MDDIVAEVCDLFSKTDSVVSNPNTAVGKSFAEIHSGSV